MWSLPSMGILARQTLLPIHLSLIHICMMLRQYAAEHGLTVVDEYIDDGWSGTNFERPSFQRMIDDQIYYLGAFFKIAIIHNKRYPHPVSYTHLDVYKRQTYGTEPKIL